MGNEMDNYITASEYARKTGMTHSAVKQRCQYGSVPGAIKVGTYPHQIWLIPADTVLTDRRVKSGKYVGWRKPKEAPETPPETPETDE